MDVYGLLAVSIGAVAVLWLGRKGLRALEAANQADWGSRWLNRLDGLTRIFCRRFHRFEHDPVPLNGDGPALLVSNHVSGLDPMLIVAACRRPVRFIIAEEQYRRFGLTWLFRAIGCIPVDRSGAASRAYRAALSALAAGEVVALFAHGRIHLDSEPPRPLKPGVARMAQLSGARICPVRIEGVRGEGHVVQAVLIRSHAHLRSFPPLQCRELPIADCLGRLREVLDARRENVAVN